MNLKNRILKKSNLWHVGAIALFLIMACAYFSPALKGFAVKQGDIVNYVGMSREIADYRDNDGEQILWTNAMFSGMPTTQISMEYENTWLTRFVGKIVRMGLPSPIFFLFVYFLGFYILSLSLRIKPFIGILGSIAFGFSSYFIVILEAGHNTKAAAIGFAPFMIAGFIMAYRSKNWILGIGLASLFMALELSANHVQITYYMLILLLLIGNIELYNYIKKGELVKFGKITGFLVVGYALAVMVNYGNIFGTADYAKQTIRGGTELTIRPDGESNEAEKTSGLDRDYITNWSYGRAESFTMIVPNFKGGQSQMIFQSKENEPRLKDASKRLIEALSANQQFGPNAPQISQQMISNIAESSQYWGDQPFTSGPVYAGIIVMFLAFLGLIYIKDKYKWALLSATLLALMLSWGKNYVSVFVLIPILAYMVNIFLDQKKQLIYSGIVTLLLFVGISSGDLFFETSLTDFFLDYMPGYNKFRAVTIILSLVELCIPILGILFLQHLIKNVEEIKKNSLGFFVVTGIFFLLILSFLAAPESFNNFLSAPEQQTLASFENPQDMEIYSYLFDELKAVRIEIFRADVLRSLGFLFVGAALIFGFIYFKFSKYILAAGLSLFILLDMVLVDQRYLNNEKSGSIYANWVEKYKMTYPFMAGKGEFDILALETEKNPTLQVKIDSALKNLDEVFKSEADPSVREKQARRDFLTFRIMNRYTNFRVYEEGNPYNSSYTSYFNKSLGGYHGAKLGRYQDLIDFHISHGNPAVINMLNTQYFLLPERDKKTREIIGSKMTQVNQLAMGNAWFAKDIMVVKNSNEEILAMDAYNVINMTSKGDAQVFVDGVVKSTAQLRGSEALSVLLPGMTEPLAIDNIPYGAVTAQPLALIADTVGLNWIYDAAPDSAFNKIFRIETGGQGGWNPAQTTIVDERFSANVSSSTYSGIGEIKMTAYHPDRMVYKSTSSEKQLAVFSEIYYEDGWKAYVDNQEVPVSRVNYVLRAIEVPAGDHEIRFEFGLKSYEQASTIALIGSILIVLLIGFGLYLEFKKKETVDEIETDTTL